MRLVTYRTHDQPRPGVLIQHLIVDLQKACASYCHATNLPNLSDEPEGCLTLAGFLAQGLSALELLANTIAWIWPEGANRLPELFEHGVLLHFHDAAILAPIPRPGKIICAAGNYPALAPFDQKPQYPTLFLKPASTVTSPESSILIPPYAQQVAYEVELAVVIGSRVKYLKPDEALSCVAGYTLANDVGDRQLEKRTSQWTTGKMMDTYTPLGPALVTRDEIPDPNCLSMRTLLNGQLVQQGNTNQMYFHVPELISYISSLTTLEPGDLILTGCPKLLGDSPAPVFDLKPGDRIEIEIEGIGKLSNPVAAEPDLIPGRRSAIL